MRGKGQRVEADARHPVALAGRAVARQHVSHVRSACRVRSARQARAISRVQLTYQVHAACQVHAAYQVHTASQAFLASCLRAARHARFGCRRRAASQVQSICQVHAACRVDVHVVAAVLLDDGVDAARACRVGRAIRALAPAHRQDDLLAAVRPASYLRAAYLRAAYLRAAYLVSGRGNRTARPGALRATIIGAATSRPHGQDCRARCGAGFFEGATPTDLRRGIALAALSSVASRRAGGTRGKQSQRPIHAAPQARSLNAMSSLTSSYCYLPALPGRGRRAAQSARPARRNGSR